jgi:GAF domain-containing protein/HAMP domain-containing protein
MTDPTRRGRLFRKYVVVLLVLVGGVLMASSLVELYFAYRETQRAILRVERARAAAAAASIERFLREVELQVRETTRTASDDPDASQVGPGRLGFREGLGAALAEQRELDFLRVLRNVPAIAQLSHLDLAGKEQLRVSRLDPDVIASQEDFSRAPKFTEARAGKTYWSPVYFRNASEPYVTLAVPCGKYAVEVTTAEVSLGAILRLASQIEVGPGGYAYVVDSRDQLVAHPDSRVLRARRDLSSLAQVRAVRAGQNGTAGDDPVAPFAMVADGLGGGRVLAAHAAITPLGWLVFVERPAADAYAPLRAPFIRSAVIFVLGLLLSILASVLLARRMVAPIRALQEGAARIGAGDLGHRILVRTGDELEALGEEFNRTAAKLEESHANLEQKVEARTRELAEANAGLTEALEQQTATAEILRAIAGSPTDIQPVLDTVVQAAARFCGATDVVIVRLDGAVLRGAAAIGQFRDVLVDQLGRLHALEVPLTRGSVTGRAVLERRTVHVHDLAAAPESEFPEGRELQRRFGHRTMVATPLLREDAPLGAIALFRMEVHPFSDKQLDLLRIFADQAVIAIENVRLFTEVRERNRELTEALEQQTATGEILRVISHSPTDVQPVFDAIVGSATRLCDAAFATVFRFDGRAMTLVADHNMTPDERAAAQSLYPRPAARDTASGRAISTRSVVHIHDVREDPEYGPEAIRRTLGFRTVLAVPMLRDGQPIGAVSLWRRDVRPFSEKQIALVTTFADQAVIAIENVRLFKELEARNHELTEALEHQTATAEILRVISASPTDVQPVFDSIAQSAARLCEAQFCFVYRFDGERLHFVAHHGVSDEGAETARLPRAAQPRERRRAGGDRARRRPDSRRPGGSRLRPRNHRHDRRLPERHRGPDAARRAPHRVDRGRAVPARAPSRAAGGAAQDVRRPGRHRRRERASVQGARGEEPRPHGDPRAADGDERSPESDQPLNVQPPARPGNGHRQRGEAGRRRMGSHLHVRRRAIARRRSVRQLARIRGILAENRVASRARVRRGEGYPRSPDGSYSGRLDGVWVYGD